MLALKVAWAYAKKYWAFIVFCAGCVIGVIVTLLVRRPSADVADWRSMIDDINRKHAAEIEKIRADDLARQEQIRKQYETTLAEIERQQHERQQALDEEKRAQIEQIIAQYGKNPDRVAAELAKLLPGVSVVLPPLDDDNN